MSDSVFERERERLADLEQQMGTAAGRLALALDRITDALCLTAQHHVYFGAGPERRLSGDLKSAVDQLNDAKELVRAVFLELRLAR